MKKLFILFVLFATICMTGCNNLDLASADYNRAQIKDLTATAGDEQVTLSWNPYDNFAPDAYHVTWGDDGEMMLETTGCTITGLENDKKYTFTIQAIYEGVGRSGEVSVECTPVTSRIALSDVTATAQSEAVTLSWTKPAENLTGYTLVYSQGDEAVETREISSDLTTVTIDGLTNYKNYTFTFTAHYPNGDSKETTVKCMPAAGPLYTISTVTPGLGALVEYKLDDAVTAVNVLWKFDDAASANGTSASHRYLTSGAHITTLIVTLADGSEINVDIEMNVRDTYFYTEDFTIASGSYNGMKGQCPVFSPDGKTVYAVTFYKPAGLYAYDIASSTKKWGYVCDSGNAAYGCAPVVDPSSGVIYFGTATAGEFYALHPDGSLKWKCTQMKSINKSYPAVGSDGTVYVLDSGNKLWALEPANGNVKWSISLSDAGANGGILVNETGTTKTGDHADEIIVGTKNNIYFIQKDGTVKASETLPSNGMTEITGFAVSPDKSTIYYCTLAGKGLYSLHLSTHEMKNFTDAAINNNAYCPVVGADGTIYFGMKTGSTDEGEAFFAVNPDMTKKWGYKVRVKNAFNYCFPAVDAQNNVYAGANDGSFLQINAAGTLSNSWSYEGGSGFMGGVNLFNYAVFSGKVGGKGNNGGLFGHYVGADRAASWCSRGGDICGTNCLK